MTLEKNLHGKLVMLVKIKAKRVPLTFSQLGILVLDSGDWEETSIIGRLGPYENPRLRLIQVDNNSGAIFVNFESLVGIP